MNLYSFSALCFSFGVTLVSVLALAKRKDLIAFRFLFFSISVSGWGYAFSFWIPQGVSAEESLFLTRVSHLFATFIPVTWIHFVFEFIKKKEPFKQFYAINYAIAAGLGATSLFTSYFVKGMHSIMDFKNYTSAGPLYHFFTLIFWIAVPYGLYSMWKAYRGSTGQSREQIKMLLLGTLFGFVSGSITFFPIYQISCPLEPLILMPLYPIFTGIALIKYGLFDAQQIADAFQREKLTALGIMAASLNHEMRNPLYVAKSKIEIYRDRQERSGPGDSREVVDYVYSQLDRTLDIMQRFSDFSRPVSLSKKEKIKVSEIVRDALELVSYEIQKKQISLQMGIPEDLTAWGQRRQVEEVFVNLMINACQAMGDKGGELSIKAWEKDDKVMVEVADTGPGIPEEIQKRLFEPFISSKGEKGTGLGLYITKQLVERNGGKIYVKSKPGKGTTFTLEFKK